MKKTYLIKDQGKGLVENLTPDKLFDIANGNDNSNTSANPLIEVTYDELVNLKNTSSLVKGQNYLLTDYMTTYEQPNTGVMMSSGIVEPLILTAVSEEQISNVCRSTLYPQDIVYYEITGDIGNNYGTEGFTKGKIYRRIDTLRNNDIGTDWRHVKYDRDGVDKLLFEDYSDVYNNTIKTYFLFNNVIGDYFHSNIIGDGFTGNTISGTFKSNKIANSFVENTITVFFDSNEISNEFRNNIIEEFGNNQISDYFQNNTIVGEFYNNTIRVYFSNNITGNEFVDNIVGSGFQNNGNQAIPFSSKSTEFRDSIISINSTPEIHDSTIDVVVFRTNGTKKQRYYDDSNNLVINSL